MTSMALKMKGLKIGYAQTPLSFALDLEIPTSATLGIIGSNGSGKSTLMKTLLGLVPPLEGSFQWQSPCRFGYVPQESQIDPLFPLTVTDLFKMGDYGRLPKLLPRSHKLSRDIDEILQALEIKNLQKALFRELSGGQKQRALLGRALIGHPDILILDEPFNNLDYAFRQKLWDLLLHWQKKYSLTLILIEHDLNRIINQVEWLVLLGAGHGFAGKTSEVLHETKLTAAYQTPLHLHEEDGKIQVHFL